MDYGLKILNCDNAVQLDSEYKNLVCTRVLRLKDVPRVSHADCGLYRKDKWSQSMDGWHIQAYGVKILKNIPGASLGMKQLVGDPVQCSIDIGLSPYQGGYFGAHTGKLSERAYLRKLELQQHEYMVAVGFSPTGTGATGEYFYNIPAIPVDDGRSVLFVLNSAATAWDGYIYVFGNIENPPVCAGSSYLRLVDKAGNVTFDSKYFYMRVLEFYPQIYEGHNIPVKNDRWNAKENRLAFVQTMYPVAAMSGSGDGGRYECSVGVLGYVAFVKKDNENNFYGYMNHFGAVRASRNPYRTNTGFCSGFLIDVTGIPTEPIEEPTGKIKYIGGEPKATYGTEDGESITPNPTTPLPDWDVLPGEEHIGVFGGSGRNHTFKVPKDVHVLRFEIGDIQCGWAVITARVTPNSTITYRYEKDFRDKNKIAFYVEDVFLASVYLAMSSLIRWGGWIEDVKPQYDLRKGGS